MMTVLNVHDLRAAPWGTPLLQGINLKLDAGEILGVIGANGAGKSTLLQLLAGDLDADGGSIELMERPLSRWRGPTRAQCLAVLPQLSLLNFPYTVEEVISLGRSPHSTGRKRDAEIVAQVMEATDTARLEGRIYTQLSGGEKQRVQLARVFAQIWQNDGHTPRLLLLDEPTAALDLAHQKLILESLRALAATGCAVIIVAHDFNLISSIADQITVLGDGRQLAQGSPETVLTTEIFQQAFDIEVALDKHPRTGRPLVISL
jgi:iron complex transport system ATP-binding protein